jgi:uncharacterized membrane protein YhhN
VSSILYALVVLVFTGLFLVAEWRKSQLGKWLTKPIASAGFVAIALHRGALGTRFGTTILIGLVLAALGDVLLIPKKVVVFRLGILSFLLGHVAYTVACFISGVGFAIFCMGLAATTFLGVLIARWLLPHAGELRVAVILYILVISTMVPAACAASWAGASMRLAAGAVAFYFSDLSVARDRFVTESFFNRAWGIPLYYLAQLLLAGTVIHS